MKRKSKKRLASRLEVRVMELEDQVEELTQAAIRLVLEAAVNRVVMNHDAFLDRKAVVEQAKAVAGCKRKGG